MAAIRHLAKAPIVEALIDFRTVEPEEGIEERLRGVAAVLRAKYPKQEDRRGRRTQFQISSEGSASTDQDLGFVGLLLTSGDGKQLVQLRSDGFTFNRLSPYTSWDDIYPQTMEAWKFYHAALGNPRITRVAVRYVNVVELADGNALTAGFRLLPQIPDEFPTPVRGLGFRLVVDGESTGSFANIGAELQPGSLEGSVRLVLDIDAYWADPLADGVAEIDERLSELRSLKNRIFFASFDEALLGSLE